ncbi:unnamed protein product [Symbiodinium microadriaticum]|nr:unnamed protein product [Symbiodinium microadriaticum]
MNEGAGGPDWATSNGLGASGRAPGTIGHPYDRAALNDALPQYIGADYEYKPYDNLQNFFVKGAQINTSVGVNSRIDENSSISFNYGFLNDEGFIKFNEYTKHNLSLGRFLDSRIGLDLSLYNKNSSDLIIDLDLDKSTGYGQSTINSAALNNKGVELGLNLVPLRMGDFNWNLTLNFTKNVATVDAIADGIDQVLVDGLSFLGNFAMPGEQFNVIQGASILRDDNGNPIVGSAGTYQQDPIQGIIGNPNPNYNMTIINTFSWKFLSFRFQFDYQDGGEIWGSTASTLTGRGIAGETDFDRFVPIVANGVAWLDGTPFGRANLTIAGQNLWYKAFNFPESINFDPEVLSLGVGMQVVRMMPMTGGNTYNNAWSANTFNGMWNTAYQGVLINTQTMIPAAQEKELWNYVGMAKLMEAQVYMTLVDFFGDVPLTEALQGTAIPSPVADPDADVYAYAGQLIDEAIAEFAKNTTVAPNTDMYYDGDLAKWAKAANTMKLRWHLNQRHVDGGAAAGITQAIANGVIESGDDFAFFAGSSRNTPSARHPWYYEHYENGNGRYLSNYYMWSMTDEAKVVNDPRIRYYFYRQDWEYDNDGKWNQFTIDFVDYESADQTILNRPAHYPAGMPFGGATNSTSFIDADGYYGRDHGNNDGIPPDGQLRTNFGIYPAGGKFDAGDPDDHTTFSHVKNNGVDGATGQGIAPIIMASYVSFMRAEAALTLGTGEDAEALLEEGMRESISYVIDFAEERGEGGGALQPTDAQIDGYVDAVLSDYAAAASDEARLEIVMREYWIALWGNGVDAYNAYRRTGYPSNMQPTRDTDAGDFPSSMFYPADVVALNGNISQKAITDQVFWNTNGSPE